MGCRGSQLGSMPPRGWKVIGRFLLAATPLCSSMNRWSCLRMGFKAGSSVKSIMRGERVAMSLTRFSDTQLGRGLEERWEQPYLTSCCGKQFLNGRTTLVENERADV